MRIADMAVSETAKEVLVTADHRRIGLFRSHCGAAGQPKPDTRK
jgi:hypothetical protein